MVLVMEMMANLGRRIFAGRWCDGPVMHLDYFPRLMGDKMSKGAKVSAVSLLRIIWIICWWKRPICNCWKGVLFKAVTAKQPLLPSSMGSLLDGIAAIYEYNHSTIMKAKRPWNWKPPQDKPNRFWLWTQHPNKSRLEWFQWCPCCFWRMIWNNGTAETGKCT